MALAGELSTQAQTGKTNHFQPEIYWNQPTMIVLQSTQDKVLAALQSVSAIVERRHNLPILANAISRRGGTTITDGFPEAGGGGAAAIDDAGADSTGGDGGAPAGAGDDDDDGGDGDGDPDRRSPSTPPKKTPSTSGTHRTVTATAGALNSPSPIAPLWRLPTVLAHVPVSRSGWWAGVAAGKYPKPVKLSARCVAWKSEDIRTLINSF